MTEHQNLSRARTAPGIFRKYFSDSGGTRAPFGAPLGIPLTTLRDVRARYSNAPLSISLFPFPPMYLVRQKSSPRIALSRGEHLSMPRESRRPADKSADYEGREMGVREG